MERHLVRMSMDMDQPYPTMTGDETEQTMADIGNRRLVDLYEDELGDLIEDRFKRALESRERQQRAPLVDSLEAGLLLGMRPRMPPRPVDEVAAAAWQREHDLRVRRAAWARVDRARRGKGDTRLLEAVADVPGVWFVRQRLEAYIASLSKPTPKLRSLTGGDRG